ncbi:MAG: PTS sugar transporter subunit IIB [Bacillota bacterium]|nr:MAG: PTS sugar transporter subunit IIB [Bacillota bacterium]
MVRILLVCSAGMSTSILIRAVEKEAVARGQQVSVRAVGTTELESAVGDADVVLVAPQVRHRFPQFAEIARAAGKPIALIEPKAYGPFGGPAILDQVAQLLSGS